MSSADVSPGPKAGWYPDPERSDGFRRYWDGERWTDYHADARAHVVDPQDPPDRLAPLAMVAVAGLTVIALVQAFNIVADVLYRDVGDRLLAGDTPTREELQQADDLVSAAGIALLVAYLVVAPLTFIPWFHRAYRNLPHLGVPSLRYGTGWAIGAWFIPLFNLVRPKQIANDIDRGSQPGAPVGDGLAALPVSPLVHWWWGLFLLQGLAGTAAGRVISAANDGRGGALNSLEQEQVGLYIGDASAAIAIIAALLGALVVRRITRGQEEIVLGLEDGDPPVSESVKVAGSSATEIRPALADEHGDDRTVRDQSAVLLCASCSTPVMVDDAFCSACGTALPRPCSSCGQPVVADGRFCPYCGTNYAE